MSLCFYLDEDSMWQALVSALRSRGVDVTTALEAGMVDRADAAHLEYATRQGRVLFSFNRGDYFELHSRYLAEGRLHAGILLANQQQYSTGELLRRILRVAAAKTPAQMQGQIEFLSRWR